MPNLPFLPSPPFVTNALVLFGVLVLVGLAGGALARKISLPTISGYVMVGILLGQTGSGFLTPVLVAEARVFVDISLAVILFDLGRRLDFQWISRDRSILWASISETVLSFILIYAALYYYGLPKLLAAIGAAIGISTSPAVVMRIAQEARAEGQVTERALTLVALNNVVAFIAVAMLLSVLHYEYQAHPITIILHPLYLLAGSVLLGVAAWYAATRIGKRMNKHEDAQFVMLIGLIILTVGIANLLKLSVLLCLLVFGVLVRNFDKEHHLLPIELAAKSKLFFVVLFVVIGATLDAAHLLTGGVVGAVYVAARSVGKVLGVMPWAISSGMSRSHSVLLGFALTPMAGFAVVMVQDVWSLYPQLDLHALAVLTSAVVLLEIIGPPIVQFALNRSGETLAPHG